MLKLTAPSSVATLCLLAGCASSSVSAPVGTRPLSHDDVVALLSSATVNRRIAGTADTTLALTTRPDGTADAFFHPGKGKFAHAGKTVHEAGTWHVEADGRFCVSLMRETTATSTWCRFIFRTETGFGGGERADAIDLEKWDVSIN